MWYTIPKTEEKQQEALYEFFKNNLNTEFMYEDENQNGYVGNEKDYKNMRSLLAAYFDETKFKQDIVDIMKVYVKQFGGDESHEGAIPENYTYAQFQDDFLNLWKTLAYSTMKDDPGIKKLNAEQDLELQEYEQRYQGRESLSQEDEDAEIGEEKEPEENPKPIAAEELFAREQEEAETRSDRENQSILQKRYKEYVVPEGKEDQLSMIQSFWNSGIYRHDNYKNTRDYFKSLTDAYFDQKQFNENSLDALYHIYAGADITGGKSKEELFPEGYTYESFQSDFLNLWRTLSYNDLYETKLTSLNPEQQLRLLKAEQSQLKEDYEDLKEDYEDLKEDYEDLKEDVFKDNEKLRKNLSVLESDFDYIQVLAQKNLADEKKTMKAKVEKNANENGEIINSAEIHQRFAYVDRENTFYQSALNESRALIKQYENFLIKNREKLTNSEKFQKDLDGYKTILAQNYIKKEKPKYPDPVTLATNAFEQAWNDYAKSVTEYKEEVQKVLLPIQTKKQELDKQQEKLDEKKNHFWELDSVEQKKIFHDQIELNKKINQFLEEQSTVYKRFRKDSNEIIQKLDSALVKLDTFEYDDTEIVAYGGELRGRKKAFQTMNTELKKAYYEMEGNLPAIAEQRKKDAEQRKKDAEQRKIAEEAERKKQQQSRADLKEALNAVKDISNTPHWYNFKTGAPKVFRNAKKAVEAYLEKPDDTAAARKAYEECRNYMATYTNTDGSVRNGSKNDNIRSQCVVRMLEIMDKLPEFQNFSKDTIHKTERNEWVNVEGNERNTTGTYTKLNFEELKDSLAENSSDKGKPKSPFYDLDKRIDKNRGKKAEIQQKAKQEKAKQKGK